MGQVATTEFDYSGLDVAVAAQLRDQRNGIRDDLRGAGESLLSAGRRLAITRELLPHGRWVAWVEAEIGVRYRTAHRWISAAELVDARNVTPESHIGVNLLAALAGPTVPDAARDEVLAIAEERPVSKREGLAIIAEHRRPSRPPPATPKASTATPGAPLAVQAVTQPPPPLDQPPNPDSNERVVGVTEVRVREYADLDDVRWREWHDRQDKWSEAYDPVDREVLERAASPDAEVDDLRAAIHTLTRANGALQRRLETRRKNTHFETVRDMALIIACLHDDEEWNDIALDRHIETCAGMLRLPNDLFDVMRRARDMHEDLIDQVGDAGGYERLTAEFARRCSLYGSGVD